MSLLASSLTKFLLQEETEDAKKLKGEENGEEELEEEEDLEGEEEEDLGEGEEELDEEAEGKNLPFCFGIYVQCHIRMYLVIIGFSLMLAYIYKTPY